MKKNYEIINTIKTRISLLEKLLNESKENKEALINKILVSYKLLQKYSYDENLYAEDIKFYEELEDNNKNLRYNNSKEYFNLIEKELNCTYNERNIKICDEDNNLVEINVLDNNENLLDFSNGLTSVFESIEKSIGKSDVFIEYRGELDNPSFMDFEDYANDKAICVRMIFTKDSTIYYYGGKNYEEVLKAMDTIESYTKLNGINYNIKNYKKKK